jgi:hypothetical protein
MSAVLSSWKDIASYMGRGIRTVQRWEAEMGLPVRRPKPRERQIVLAFPEELDTWLHSAPRRQRPDTAATLARTQCLVGVMLQQTRLAQQRIQEIRERAIQRTYSRPAA